MRSIICINTAGVLWIRDRNHIQIVTDLVGFLPDVGYDATVAGIDRVEYFGYSSDLSPDLQELTEQPK